MSEELAIRSFSHDVGQTPSVVVFPFGPFTSSDGCRGFHLFLRDVDGSFTPHVRVRIAAFGGRPRSDGSNFDNDGRLLTNTVGSGAVKGERLPFPNGDEQNFFLPVKFAGGWENRYWLGLRLDSSELDGNLRGSIWCDVVYRDVGRWLN